MKLVLPVANNINTITSSNSVPKLCFSNTQSPFSPSILCDGTFNFLDFDIYGMPRYQIYTNPSNYYAFIWLKFSSVDFPYLGRWGIINNTLDPLSQPISVNYVANKTQKLGEMPIIGEPNTYLNYPRLVYTGLFQYCDTAYGACP